ncbi:hypothetical protein [Stenotrophomonas sp. BIGb0135]|uniref:hypothetical protein n=1 Tax=Stenotrophomonas sp. BIGb0135 TaxID=2940620 RepID=UPI0021676A85|nr:hypothetical protein [Stenotrophomonas sp. BIGb0135]MCS4236388.1 hypothetical protein [Stenotrophomonas sp. BIGb0135]
MTERFEMEINGTRYTRLADVPPEYRALLVHLDPARSAEQPAVPLREILHKAKAQPDRARRQQVALEALAKVDPARARRLQNTLTERIQRPATGTLEVGTPPSARPRDAARHSAAGMTVAPGDRGGLGLWVVLAGVVVATVVAWIMR